MSLQQAQVVVGVMEDNLDGRITEEAAKRSGITDRKGIDDCVQVGGRQLIR